MVVCCSALFWYLDRGISFLHAEIVERLSWSESLYHHRRPCCTFQPSLQHVSMQSTDSALEIVKKKDTLCEVIKKYSLYKLFLLYNAVIICWSHTLYIMLSLVILWRSKHLTTRSISITMSLSLPAHGCELQRSVLVVGPGHLFPPCWACLATVLVNVLTPPPQALSHLPALPPATLHAPQWQCTEIC